MKKDQKKALQGKIILAIEQVLAENNSKVTGKINKHIKEAGKAVIKKFAQELKKENKRVKRSGKSKGKSVTERAIANGAPKIPAHEATALKEAAQ